MKIIRVYILIILLLVLSYLAGLFVINSTGNEKIDLSYINTVTKEINTQYKNDDIDVFNNERYKITLVSDSDYMSNVNAGINGDCVITDIMDGDRLVGKIIFYKEIRQNELIKNKLMFSTTIVFVVLVLILLISFSYTYFNIIKPFETMKSFAKNVAAGDFEFKLGMDKNNYFGAFTESFDLMRDELNNAKKGEYEANISKKELVASLSHDIKTPVATIKALCEMLEIKVEGEDCKKNVHTIADKAAVIDHLVSDMFNSTLEDLNELKINVIETSSAIISDTIDEINIYSKVEELNIVPQCLIWCDRIRTVQVIDNIISNSYKYSNSNIYVSYKIQDGLLLMRIKDDGVGVPEEDLPMICEKFYRGSNASEESGSGLGLYLSKQFMAGMNGYMDCYNDDGFVVELRFKLV